MFVVVRIETKEHYDYTGRLSTRDDVYLVGASSRVLPDYKKYIPSNGIGSHHRIICYEVGGHDVQVYPYVWNKHNIRWTLRTDARGRSIGTFDVVNTIFTDVGNNEYEEIVRTDFDVFNSSKLEDDPW